MTTPVQGIEKTRELLGICTEFGRSLSEGQDPAETLKHFLSKLNSALGAIGMAVWQPDPVDGFMQITASVGLPEPYVTAGNENSRTDPNRSITPVYQIFEKQEPRVFTGLMSLQNPFAVYAKRLGFDSLYVVPLGREGKRLGVMVLYHPQDLSFNSEELLDWTSFLAQQVALALYLMQHRLEIRASEEISRYRVQEAIAAKDGLFHDLAFLTGSMQMLSDRGGFQHEPGLEKQTLATLRRTVQSMLRLVDLVSLDPRHMPLRHRETGLKELIEAAVDWARHEGAKGEVHLIAEGESLPISVDTSRIQAALAGLIFEALRRSPEGLRIVISASGPGWGRVDFPETDTTGWEAVCIPVRAVVEAHGGRFVRRPDAGLWFDLPILA